MSATSRMSERVSTHRRRHAIRWAVVLLVLGTPTGEGAARFASHVARRFPAPRCRRAAVLIDNGPGWVPRRCKPKLATCGLDHHRIPPRCSNRNAACERFHGTALQECRCPAFRRRRFTGIGQLQNEMDAWLVGYNRGRRDHGDFLRPTPLPGPRLRRAQPSIMSATQRVQLSPRTPARKPEPCAEDGSSGGCVLAVGDRCGDCWRARLPPVIVGDEDLLLDSHEG
jgi:hypothetical protein